MATDRAGSTRRRAFDVLATIAPDVQASAIDLQRARRSIANAVADTDDITHPRLRLTLRRALLRAASELGCAVCGKPIEFEELELTEFAFVHLWGACSDKLAAALNCTIDEALSGEVWEE